MSQQGGSPTGHDDDWWGQLYDEATEDTGPTPAPDSLDDRFASASGAVGGPDQEGAEAAQAPPRAAIAPQRTPWEPPPAAPAGPAAISAQAAAQAGGRTSTETPATTAPASATSTTDTVADTDGAEADQPREPVPDGQAARTATRLDVPTLPPAPVDYVGSGPPTYEAEPTALPPADPDDLDDLVADTVLDGARYGACLLRAASVRGDSARYRGEPRRDSLLTARFGTGEQALVLVAMATGARATPGAHRAAAEACHWIGRAVGRSHARLAEDIRAGRRGDLKSGLHRLTDRSLGKLRASAAEQGVEPEEYAATLRCLLLPADPECRTRVFFGVGAGGLFRLRDGDWQDIEPRVGEVAGEPVVGFGSLPAETPDGDRLTMDLGIPTPPSPYDPAPEPPREPFRFRASVARTGDALLMCTGGLAEPLRGEPDLCRHLATRWSGASPPGLAAFLADTQVRVKGYADDRTAAAVWEA
ncbi:PP2C family serine/threonine-protein phosphatase [Streptomyces sp. NPDC050534]|uniref:PP2C family serine/threonine-protein phosphatase n=1 Tax=Streptomyces sp. NPDC050534 TaxID=3365625 RepID=UPI0037B341AB